MMQNKHCYCGKFPIKRSKKKETLHKHTDVCCDISVFNQLAILVSQRQYKHDTICVSDKFEQSVFVGYYRSAKHTGRGRRAITLFPNAFTNVTPIFSSISVNCLCFQSLLQPMSSTVARI